MSVSRVCGLINKGQTWDCTNKSTGGLEQIEVILFNRSDIDLENTVIQTDASNGIHKIANLELKDGAKVYSFQGIPGKRMLKAGYQLQVSDFLDTFSHNVTIAIYDQCEESLVTLNQFANGAEVVAIVQNRTKGVDNKCSYQIFGFDRGLKASELTYDSNENWKQIMRPQRQKLKALKNND